MAIDLHHYDVTVDWTGNLGTGTSSYREYSRDHVIQLPGLPELPGSSDPAFRGDKTRYNPEQFLLTALAQCHMLSYLHVAVMNGVVVTGYRDQATGTMRLNRDGSGQFEEVMLNPVVTVAEESMLATANELHREANRLCFIANSVNFPVHHRPSSQL
ncbi:MULTISPECIES: OsmC family protein [Arthrobacter]|uniref:OsmC family protein n=2 Tax=Arthrobacter TaxID=1663 RepID=A0ABU9KHM3_9MICC|nr:OsmC family protein [Arthrobacter sp. YJM1]MDP5225645.1 OsmC family protein [Arthrobacter sp. YJM1]